MEKKFKTDLLSIGEFFDRFTIMIRKAKFEDTDHYKKRVEEYIKILNENGENGRLLYLLCKLQMLNTDIWNLEGELRQGKEGILGVREIGERALKIRDVNKERIETVNELNELFGITDRKETKFEHASN